jgi:hypothetical protein
MLFREHFCYIPLCFANVQIKLYSVFNTGNLFLIIFFGDLYS